MNRRSILAIVLVVGVVTALGGLVFIGLPSLFGITTHSYAYQATISTNETLHDATFYLPVPAAGENATLEDVTISNERGNQTDWESEVVKTEDGPMLRIQADQVPGERRWRVYSYDENGSVTNVTVVTELPADMSNKRAHREPTTYHLYAQWETDEEIDTQAPLDDEPVLVPRKDVAPTECEWPIDEDEEDRCYTYRSRVFAEYQSAGNGSDGAGTARVSGEFYGTNEWGFAFSNSYNTYTQRYGPVAVSGDGNWTPINVSLHTGEGRYPTVNY